MNLPVVTVRRSPARAPSSLSPSLPKPCSSGRGCRSAVRNSGSISPQTLPIMATYLLPDLALIFGDDPTRCVVASTTSSRCAPRAAGTINGRTDHTARALAGFGHLAILSAVARALLLATAAGRHRGGGLRRAPLWAQDARSRQSGATPWPPTPPWSVNRVHPGPVLPLWPARTDQKYDVLSATLYGTAFLCWSALLAVALSMTLGSRWKGWFGAISADVSTPSSCLSRIMQLFDPALLVRSLIFKLTQCCCRQGAQSDGCLRADPSPSGFRAGFPSARTVRGLRAVMVEKAARICAGAR